jgi:hypothetical protein
LNKQSFLALLGIVFTFWGPQALAANLSYNFKFFHDQLLIHNDEIKAKKRDQNLAEENLNISKAGLYPKLDLKLGGNGGNEQEAVSSESSSSYKVNSDSMSAIFGLSYNIFSRFAIQNSIKNAKNTIHMKGLESDLLLARKKRELINVLLEVQGFRKIKNLLSRAEKILNSLNIQSHSKARTLFFGPGQRLKINKKYKEVLYQKEKVNGILDSAHLVLLNLIPAYKKKWIEDLPKLSLQYTLPDFEKAVHIYKNNSKEEKNLSLNIVNFKNIYNTTTWERPWVPLTLLSASHSSSQSFKTNEISQNWSVSMAMQFNLFDGFYSKARKSQAHNLYQLSKIKKRDQLSKGLILLQKDYSLCKIALSKKIFKESVLKEKQQKMKTLKNISNRGVSTKTEKSLILLDLAKTKIDILEARKDYELGLLNVASHIDELHKVKINEK